MVELNVATQLYRSSCVAVLEHSSSSLGEIFLRLGINRGSSFLFKEETGVCTGLSSPGAGAFRLPGLSAPLLLYYTACAWPLEFTPVLGEGTLGSIA
jgi:hypothetical protein